MLEFTFEFKDIEEIENMLELMDQRQKKLYDSIEMIREMDFTRPERLIEMIKEELEPLKRNARVLRRYLTGEETR